MNRSKKAYRTKVSCGSITFDGLILDDGSYAIEVSELERLFLPDEYLDYDKSVELDSLIRYHMFLIEVGVLGRQFNVVDIKGASEITLFFAMIGNDKAKRLVLGFCDVGLEKMFDLTTFKRQD